MFKNVSCFVSPPNGLKPLKRTYANTPIDQISVFSDNGSYDRTYVEINKNQLIFKILIHTIVRYACGQTQEII